MSLQQTVASFFPPPLLRILVAIVPVALVCAYLSRLHDPHPAPETMTAAAVAARLAPVAYVLAVAADAKDAPAAAPIALLSGQAVYEATCTACHGGGIAGAPKFGDNKAWAARIAQGFDTLVKHAIAGYTGKAGMMPPKGGGSYEDVEVARAVAYMADKAGAKFAEPAALAKK
jgi:cytochrome c5